MGSFHPIESLDSADCAVSYRRARPRLLPPILLGTHGQLPLFLGVVLIPAIPGTLISWLGAETPPWIAAVPCPCLPCCSYSHVVVSYPRMLPRLCSIPHSYCKLEHQQKQLEIMRAKAIREGQVCGPLPSLPPCIFLSRSPALPQSRALTVQEALAKYKIGFPEW